MFYCIIGIAGGAVFSFLISWFFFYIGSHDKILYVDMISNGKSSNSENDFVCLIKNVGRSPLLLTDFAPANRPHFMAEAFTDIFTVIPPYKANFNNVSVKIEGNSAYLLFDYLNRKEAITVVFKGTKGILGYKATMIGGTEIHYNRMIHILKNARSITSAGLIINIGSLLMFFNARIGIVFATFGFVLWYTITSNILYYRFLDNHLKLLKHLK